MRFHKPHKKAKKLLTYAEKSCIIERMFVFGRSLPRSGGDKTQKDPGVFSIGWAVSDPMPHDGASTPPVPPSPHAPLRSRRVSAWEIATAPSPTGFLEGLFRRAFPFCVKTSQYITPCSPVCHRLRRRRRWIRYAVRPDGGRFPSAPYGLPADADLLHGRPERNLRYNTNE